MAFATRARHLASARRRLWPAASVVALTVALAAAAQTAPAASAHVASAHAASARAASTHAASAHAASARAAPSGARGSATTVLHDGDGLRVTAERQLDRRLIAFDVSTSALPKPVDVRILLPSGYAAHPHRHYPVLYLLDGTSGMASDWTTLGGAEQTTAHKPLIVVMPNIDLDGDGGGWCTNWPDGAERWETFDIDQLIPWVDRNLRTIAARRGRAIAGLSQGGFCSMSYAARHPELFGMALAYSGAPDIFYDGDARFGAMSIINATEVGLDRVPPDTFFGSPVTDAINWAAHDPATLAENLSFTRMALYWGNGLPGPYDTEPNPEAETIEGAINRDNQDFETRLHALRIPATFVPYGDGTHSWPYWARDLRWSIGAIAAYFAHPPRAPRTIRYTTDAASYAQWGWHVSVVRQVTEFSTISDANAHGFALAGSGRAVVVTPAIFRRGGRYRVTIDARSGRSVTTEVAHKDRRLTIAVPLGPSNRVQEYTAGDTTAGTSVYTTTVWISAVRGVHRVKTTLG